MIKQPTRMLDDPSEPAFVRELLQAGVDDEVTNYDYSKGLVKHLAIVAAGTLLPIWAKGLISGSGTSSAISGASAKVIAFIVGLPVATAGVVASIMIANSEPQATPVRAPKPTPVRTSEKRSQSVPSEITRLKEIIIPVRPVSTKEPPGAVYRKARTARFASSRERGVVERSQTRERTANEKTELQLTPALDLNARRRGEARMNERLSSTPAIRRATVSELRQERVEPREKPKVEVTPFERETRMLAAANRLLESDPERSLDLAERGEREFPGSMFTEERRHVLILALIRLSRVDEARQLAGPYLLDYPNSPFAQRVRHALAKAQRQE